ncbi:MAG: helix-turn-helix domain-containing protein [Candidatus Dojkabacteria bacterium]|nr:helix-turn-helix domain-containing protein [Candidatus Dojkabacteria bacterium]MDQ7021345.1 helix-turn-helix domain-containing protein [Candidatus Dojkabacteria bacterium]
MKDLTIILKFLSTLGLDVEKSKLYLALMQKGGQTVLQLSRTTGISRTSTYRFVEELIAFGLIEQVEKDNKKILMPVGLHKLELLVKEHESKTETLKKLLPELSNFIASDISLSQPGTKVIMYKGTERIKQMVWNILQAKEEIVGYTFRDLSELIGLDFYRKWKMEFILKKLKFRDLVNEDYTDEPVLASGNEKAFKTKTITSNVLKISHQVDIYNDIVSYYTWHDDEVFGLEIYNSKIAKFQRQMFELAWNAAM